LIVDVDAHGNTKSTVRLLACSTQGQFPLRAYPEGEENPLVVRAAGSRDENGFFAFEVELKPGGQVKESVFNLILELDAPGKQSLKVPVMVRRSGIEDIGGN
jgi:hypothetical protein